MKCIQCGHEIHELYGFSKFCDEECRETYLEDLNDWVKTVNK